MSEPVKAAIVYATFPDIETAKSTAQDLVEAHLAGCVNLLPDMTSVYSWQGKIETAEEIVMIVKTRQSLCDKVIAAIESSHPYDTPAAVVLKIESGARRYLDWIASETMVA